MASRLPNRMSSTVASSHATSSASYSSFNGISVVIARPPSLRRAVNREEHGPGHGVVALRLHIVTDLELHHRLHPTADGQFHRGRINEFCGGEAEFVLPF